jgi:hypothetical protein
MPTYYARKAGNINAADVWATTPAGTASAVTFAAGDVLVANSFTITVNVTTNLGASGEVRTDTTGGATLGGSFVLTDGVTLTANAIFGNTTASLGVNYLGSTSATLIGNITVNAGRGGHGGIGTLNFVGNISGANALNTAGFYITGGGTLNVTGNIFGGSLNAGAYGLWTTSTVCTINITGNVTGGALGVAIFNTNNSAINITGNVTGGTGIGAVAITNSGASNLVAVNGQSIGGSQAAGITNSSTGTIRATRAVGNAYGPGNTAGITAQVGVANSGLGIVEIEQMEYGTFGQSPVSGTGVRLKKASSNVAVFNFCDTAGAKTLIDATQNAAMPAATDVRSGLSYAGGAATGTLAVPLPSQVAVGVATDNTVGTAFVTGSDIATAVWGAATRTLTAGAGITAAEVWSHSSRTVTGGTVDTLTNAPTVPSASAIASAVWAAADKTGYSLTSAERTAIASAVEASILNEGDGQAILNAIVTSIGNTNISQVALVAAIRSDLATELGRIDAAISSRAVPGDIPTESEIASAVWEKPTTELTITGSIGERAKNQSTVSTTGAQLAAALS